MAAKSGILSGFSDKSGQKEMRDNVLSDDPAAVKKRSRPSGRLLPPMSWTARKQRPGGLTSALPPYGTMFF